MICLTIACLAASNFTYASPTETRYFTSLNDLMDENDEADVVLKETRRGKTVTAAELDVCYTADKTSNRKDRFVVSLAVDGQSLSGKTQSTVGKLPITVQLTRKPAPDDGFEFRSKITIGTAVREETSTDNHDISEKDFQRIRDVEDDITPQPKDFTEVSPEAVGVRMKLDAVPDFLKSLKGQDVEVWFSSLAVTCEELRTGQKTINMSIDPDRAGALIAKAKAMPGVTLAGWTTGDVDMERVIRFAAAGWRDGGKLNRDKLVTAISGVLTKTLDAKFVSADWSTTTGEMTLTFKRTNPIYPALELTDTIDVVGLIAPDKPDGSDSLMLWLDKPVVSTADESPGAKLNLSDKLSEGEDDATTDNTDSIEALTKELQGQRWDAEKSKFEPK
jgi:hypothetical protein